MQSQTYTLQADYSVSMLATMPEPGIVLIQPVRRYYAVHVVVHDEALRVDIDTFIQVYASDEDDVQSQCQKAFRDAFGRPPYYERYTVL